MPPEAAPRFWGTEVLRSEDIPARPDTAERACLDLVRRADVVITLLGARYGAPTTRAQSPTHQEYAEAQTMHKDVQAQTHVPASENAVGGGRDSLTFGLSFVRGDQP
jgi:hypothetical protein